ncbi:MAG: 3-isopropylmalate dehydratase large subunit [Gammaproteobacteria bacterium]|nr:3-isopropylmalate dehydratase large subunit [Gammaproteobacteria bacterium]
MAAVSDSSSALTLAQRIIQRAAGVADVTPGAIVTCKVDLAMIHDSGGPRRVEPVLQELNAPLFDHRRVVLVADHYVPADEPESRGILELTRRWAIEREVTFYDGEGICHVLLPERGHLAPGMLVVGGDSHSPTGGAFGAYMFGVGSTEMAGVLATGEIWLQVPRTILLEWNGVLAPGVAAKDMMLSMCAALGMDGGGYQAIEYTGNTITSLPMQERMTLCNMAAELGAQAGLIAPDKVTLEAMRRAGRHEEIDLAAWSATDPAKADSHHRFDATALVPQVASPDSPANAASVSDSAGQPIDVAYIGACTGAKYDDLAMAAGILRGQRVAPNVELIVAPASRQDQERARSDGIMQLFEQSGARFLDNACGICAGYGRERLGPETRCISTTARNFKGRMGDASSRVWLASPYTVAASALSGVITDPRTVIADVR